jgi:hypothetical protein
LEELVKAVVALDYGPPENYVVTEVPVPRPGPGQIQVRIAAASINPADVRLTSGEYQEVTPITFPHVVGPETHHRQTRRHRPTTTNRPAGSTAMTSDLDGQQRAFRDAELHGDTARLQALLTEDFRSIGDQGVQLDKTQWIGRHAEFVYLSIEMTELSLDRYDNAAILRYVQCSNATWRGTAMRLTNRVSQVWIKQSAGWKLASIQFSSLPDNWSEPCWPTAVSRC